MQSLVQEKWRPAIKCVIPVLCYLVLAWLPPPQGLTALGMKGFALVAAGIVALTIQPISIALLVPLVVLLSVPLKILTMPEAMNSFMGPAFIYIFAMVCLSIAFQRSGLARRIALGVVGGSQGKPKLLLFLFTATAMLSSTVMADIPILLMLYPICMRVIKNNGCDIKGSNFAKSLLLCIATGSMLGGMGTPAGSAANPVSIQILQDYCNYSISFMEWSAIGLPIVICLVPCVWAGYAFFLPSEIDKLTGMEELAREKAQLGPMSSAEKAFIIIFTATLLLWFTDKFNGIPVQTTSILAICALSLPGVAVFNWERDHSEITWDAIMLVGGSVTLGIILTKTGVCQWFAETWLIGLVSTPAWVIYACVCLVMIWSQFPFLAPVSAVAALGPAFIAIAQMKGIPTVGIVMTTALSTATIVLAPAQVFYIIVNRSRLLTIKDAWKGGFLTTFAQLGLVLFFMFTIGRGLGFV